MNKLNEFIERYLAHKFDKNDSVESSSVIKLLVTKKRNNFKQNQIRSGIHIQPSLDLYNLPHFNQKEEHNYEK